MADLTHSLPPDSPSVSVFIAGSEAIKALAARALDSSTSALSAGESTRIEAFSHDGARTLAASSRQLVRERLADRFGVAPREVDIIKDNNDRPVLQGDSSTTFNISHTDGAVVVALGSHVECVGVDVEDLQRDVRSDALINRFFHPLEVTAMASLDAIARRERFFVLWTLKEAYMKARGRGFGIPLSSFAIDPDGRLLYEPPDSPDHTWLLRTGRWGSHHRVSLATGLDAASSSLLRVSVTQVQPASSECALTWAASA